MSSGEPGTAGAPGFGAAVAPVRVGRHSSRAVPAVLTGERGTRIDEILTEVARSIVRADTLEIVTVMSGVAGARHAGVWTAYVERL